tara:strand:- start:2733 stop:3395 length:663 start_codon:yes stop_codon:yes gene_type:complete
MEENRHTNEVEGGTLDDFLRTDDTLKGGETKTPFGATNFSDPKGSEPPMEMEIDLQPFRVVWVFVGDGDPKGSVVEIPNPFPKNWPNPKGFVFGIIDPNDSPKGLSDDEELDELTILALIGDKGEGWNKTGFDEATYGECSVCEGQVTNLRLDSEIQHDWFKDTYGVYPMNQTELMDYCQSRRDFGQIEPNLSPTEMDLCCRFCGAVDIELKAKALNEGF